MTQENRTTNPNGANGTTSDPREQIMWDIYVEKLKNGVENALASALEAGYEESSARSITAREWFLERKNKLRRKGILTKAEKVLDKTLSYETENEKGEVNTPLLKIQVDAAKMVAGTLGSKEGYVSKSEVEVTTLSEEEKRKMRGLLVEVPEETLRELINDNETSVG